ncbi:MAG: RpiB/LacA/LacB family sugar-phosphate isomerase [Candidatus Limnocylindrales bacterium]|jgi:ribose 5-phosphate isomerase B
MNTKRYRLIVGADHIGLPLKNVIRDHLLAEGFAVDDVGVESADPVDYPDIALRVAEDIIAGRHQRGILVCGTGIGMAIVANKVPGIRAAQIADPHSAVRAAKSNNAQIVTLGSETIGPESAKLLVDAFLASEFAGGRSLSKVAKIDRIDEHYRRASLTPPARERPSRESLP